MLGIVKRYIKIYNVIYTCVFAVYLRTNGWRERRSTAVMGCGGWSSSSGVWVPACGRRRRSRGRRVAAAGRNNNIYLAALKAPRKEESVINYLLVAYRTRPFPRPCAQMISCHRFASEGTAIQYNIIYTTYTAPVSIVSSPSVVGGRSRRR